MPWIAILFVCFMGSCEFVAGDAYWSPTACERELVYYATKLEELGAVVAGVCVQVKVT